MSFKLLLLFFAFPLLASVYLSTPTKPQHHITAFEKTSSHLQLAHSASHGPEISAQSTAQHLTLLLTKEFSFGPPEFLFVKMQTLQPFFKVSLFKSGPTGLSPPRA